MNDQELLEKAASAAGDNVVVRTTTGVLVRAKHQNQPWNPLEDDGDAFRLMIRLKLLVDVCDDDSAEVVGYAPCFIEETADDAGANTRRAIVRAAAAMGEKA